MIANENIQLARTRLGAFTGAFRKLRSKGDLTPEEMADQAQLAKQIQDLRIIIALRDAWFFILNFGYSQDERDVEEPFKPFIGLQEEPQDYRYFKELTQLWLNELLLIVPKSRQLRITWLFCHLYLWDVLTNTGRLNGMQTKNEEAANKLIGRVEVIIQNLPPGLRPLYKRTFDPPKIRILNPKNPKVILSEIWGLPQGENVGRSHTFSNYLIDEAWLQDDLEETYCSARPASVRLTMVCSAPRNLNKSAVFFGQVSDDEYGIENVPDSEVSSIIPGYSIDVRRNKNGFVRAGVFYWHVPHRWLITKKDGVIQREWVTTDVWEKGESRGYSDIAWRREQRGEFGVSLGEQIFEMKMMREVEKTIRPPLAVGKLVMSERKEIKFIDDVTGPLEIYEWPVKEDREKFGRVKVHKGQYAAGADIGAGLSASGDYSVAAVGNKKAKEVSALWRGRRRPIAFAHELYMLLAWYNNAFIVPESNSYGLSTIDELKDGNRERGIPPYGNIYRSKMADDIMDREQQKYGWYTSWKSKWKLIEQFAEAVRDNRIIITSRQIAQEMGYYIKFEDGKTGASRGKDDCVIATALLYQGFKDDPYIKPEEDVVADKYWEEDEEELAGTVCNVTGY